MSDGLRLPPFDLHLFCTETRCFLKLYGVVHTLFAEKNDADCLSLLEENGGGGMLPLCTNDAKWKVLPSQYNVAERRGISIQSNGINLGCYSLLDNMLVH